MKNLVYALLALFGVLVTVIIISILLSSVLREIEESVEAYPTSGSLDFQRVESDFKLLRDDFSGKLSMLSLLISDEALLDIERSFSDVISYAEAESRDGVISAIGRLGIELEHIRELAGFNIKSVF
ncbi:MAG: DUF4363 family protein [Clostridia bacterium]|nr:DUF4363 family protein [Clostridia bacterium]